MNKKDKILIFSALALVLVLGGIYLVNRFSNKGEVVVEIVKNNEVIYSEKFDDDLVYSTEINIDGQRNIIKIENGEVYMEFSNCPDQICVNQGSINKDSLLPAVICAPNSVVISLIGLDSELDT